MTGRGSVAVALALLLVACATPEAGCAVYAVQRIEMPRPLPDNGLGAWVAVTDAAMTGACR